MKIAEIIKSKTFIIGILIVVLAVLACMPFYGPGAEYAVILFIAFLMYLNMTVAWAMFSGPTGYLSLASAAFFGIGIYAMALLGDHMPVLAAVFIGGLVSAVLGLLVGFLTLRLRGVYFAIFTFGLVLLVQRLMLWYEMSVTHTRGRMVVLVDNPEVYWILLGIFVILMLVSFFLKRSKWGLALVGIGEYEEAADHVGVNVNLLKTLVFALSAFFIGATGAIIATRWTYIDPYVAFLPLNSFMPIFMSILGGMTHLWGPVLGAVIFSYLEELLLTKFPYVYMLIFGFILIIVIVFLPGGLAGLVDRIRTGGFKRRNATA
jgi:branched-chain amino acid transport system permease protein